MTAGYSIALVAHLFALLAAFGASTIVHVAMLKVRSASRGADGLPWLGLAHAFARVFPVALLVLLASGAWLVHERWTWDTGFVWAGLAGIAFLFVCGPAVEGRRAGAVAAALAAAPDGPPAPALVRDRLWWCASFANSGVALGVVAAMAAKPSAAAAFGLLAAGLCAGAAAGELVRGSERRTAVPARTAG